MRRSHGAGTPATEYRLFISPNKNGVRSEVLTPSAWGRNRTRIPSAAGAVTPVPTWRGLPPGVCTSPPPGEIDGALPVVVGGGASGGCGCGHRMVVGPPPLTVPELRGRVEHDVRRSAGHVLQRCRICMHEIEEAVGRLIPWRDPYRLRERSVEDHGLGRDPFEELRGGDCLIRDVIERLLVVHGRRRGEARSDENRDDPAVRDFRHPNSPKCGQAYGGEQRREEQEGAVVELAPESEDVRSRDDARPQEPRKDKPSERSRLRTAKQDEEGGERQEAVQPEASQPDERGHRVQVLDRPRGGKVQRRLR